MIMRKQCSLLIFLTLSLSVPATAGSVWKDIQTTQSLKVGAVVQFCITEGNGGAKSFCLASQTNQEATPTYGLILKSGQSNYSTTASSYQSTANRITNIGEDGGMLLESYQYSNNFLTIANKNGTTTEQNIYRSSNMYNLAAIYRNYDSNRDECYRWKIVDLGDGLFRLLTSSRSNGFLCFASRGSASVQVNYATYYASTYCSSDISFSNQQKENKTFEELLSAAGLSNSSNNQTFTPSASKHIPGAWKITQLFTTYATTFDAGTGHFDDMSTSKVIDDAYFHWPNVVAPHGYVHSGWSTGDGYDAVAHDDCDGYYIPNQSRTLYASYTPLAKLTLEAWQENSVRIQYLGEGVSVDSKVCYSHSGNVYVGGYYGAKSTVDLADVQVDHGVYEIPVAAGELVQHAGKELVLTFYNQDGDVIGVQQLTIPNIINTKSALASTWAIAAEHDVVILSGQKLTIDTDVECETLTINPGGVLVVNQGATITMDCLYARGGDLLNGQYSFTYPQMIVNGTVQTTGDTIYYDYLLGNTQYYSLTLPYAVNTTSIKYADGKKAIFGIQEYDGSLRLNGISSGWVNTIDATNRVDCMLEPYKGYVIFALPQLVQYATGEKRRRNYSTLRIPMEVDLHNGEAAVSTTRSVSVIPHGAGDDNVRPNDKGWNLVGNPYLADFNGIEGLSSTNGIGLLEDNGEEYEWIGNLRYVVIPFDNGLGYQQELASAIILPAFKNFFVQIGTGDALNFAVANRAQHIAERYYANELEEEWMVRLSLQKDDNSLVTDKCGLLIGDAYTDEYEINADLQKWMNEALNLYMVSPKAGGNLAYMAIPTQSLQQIQMGYTAKAGSYTLRLDSVDYSEWQSIILYDSEQRKSVDLLASEYHFSTVTQTNNTRFMLSLVRNMPAPSSLDELHITDGLRMVDVLGREISNTNARPGVYIRIDSNSKPQKCMIR